MPTYCSSNHLYTFPVIRRHHSESLTSLWDFTLPTTIPTTTTTTTTPPTTTTHTHRPPHMQRNHRTVGSSAQMCSHPFREHIVFHRHLVWLLSYTHKSARPLSQLKSLKPSDAYISQWIKPPSVQTMTCLAISLTDVNLLFIGAKEIYFYEIIFEIQTKNIFEKVIAKCQSFRPGINESEWALWITCELSRTFRWVIRVSFSLSCMCIFWFQDN